MTALATKAPHRLPAGEQGLTPLETSEARAIAARWINPAQRGITAFATGARMDAAALVAAVREVRCDLGEHHAHELRLLLAHLQGLCEIRRAEHDQDAPWCWCQPFAGATTCAGTARW